jgi:hypothetical protein
MSCENGVLKYERALRWSQMARIVHLAVIRPNLRTTAEEALGRKDVVKILMQLIQLKLLVVRLYYGIL